MPCSLCQLPLPAGSCTEACRAATGSSPGQGRCSQTTPAGNTPGGFIVPALEERKARPCYSWAYAARERSPCTGTRGPKGAARSPAALPKTAQKEAALSAKPQAAGKEQNNRQPACPAPAAGIRDREPGGHEGVHSTAAAPPELPPPPLPAASRHGQGARPGGTATAETSPGHIQLCADTHRLSSRFLVERHHRYPLGFPLVCAVMLHPGRTEVTCKANAVFIPRTRRV